MGVYLDYQATSPMPESVLEVYVSALAGVGNPSSIHQAGQRQRALVEEARERIARVVGCEPIEIVFTSGGTEAINPKQYRDLPEEAMSLDKALFNIITTIVKGKFIFTIY